MATTWFHRAKRGGAAAAPYTGACPAPATLLYAKTVGGDKVHIVRADNLGLTLCGFDTYQTVLVERPVPRGELCEWCSAA